jgi:hypothetical protein
LANRSTLGSRQRLLVLMTIYSLGKGYSTILFGKKHLHVSESDQIVDSLLKFLKVTSGSVKLEVANRPVLKIEIGRSNHVESDTINRTIVKLDLLEPTFLGVSDEQASIIRNETNN